MTSDSTRTIQFTLGAFTVLTAVSVWQVYRDPAYRIAWFNTVVGFLGMVITARQLLPRLREPASDDPSTQ
jgi:hypothetical protein